jgi:hypothetical protein
MATKAEKLAEAAYGKFRVFLFLMWRHLGLPNPTPAQYAMADFLQYGDPRKCIMAFRGIGKSWVTAAYVLWCLWRNPQEKILVLSASGPRAVDFATFVKRVIAEWPLIATLKALPGQRDSVLSFDVGPAKAAQSASMKASGIMGQIAGSRAHRIVLDDVEVPGNSETVTMREKLADRVKEAAAILIPDKDLEPGFTTSIIYLGTPQTEDSLYVKLPERGYSLRIWPARFPDAKLLTAYAAMGAQLFPEATQLLTEGAVIGAPTDAERFTEEDLLSREKEYGPTGWQLQFMLNPSLADAERYPLKLRDLVIGSFDSELVPNKVIWSGDRDYTAEDLHSVGLSGDKFQRRMVVRDTMTHQEVSGFGPYEGTGLLTIDPSGRGKDETSWNVTKMLNGQIFLVAQGGFRGNGYDEETLTKLALIYNRFDCGKVRIEANFGDGMYTKLLSPIFKKHCGRGLDPDEVEFKNQTVQKELRIIDVLEPLMSNHKLIVDESVVRDDWNRADPSDPDRLARMLFYQLTRLTRERGCLKFDDRIDCLAMACHYWLSSVGKDVDENIKGKREEALLETVKRWKEQAETGSMLGNTPPPASKGTLGRWGLR